MPGTQNNGLQRHDFHPLDKDLISEYNFVRTSPNKEYLCFAPLTSLFFDVTGDVYACCENTVYKYAVYPDQSIHDIWFGEKVQKLREHIRNNDLNLGCFLCSYNIETKNFSGVKARFYDYAKSTGEFPVRMEFQLANTCNLECAMCDGWSSSLILKNKYKLPPLSNPYNDHFVEQLEEFIPHLQQAFFVGGEPFMIELYYKIWEKIIELNPSCVISVQTNGTILNQKVKALLEKGNFEINVSLDSVRKENYEKIRKNATFEKTMQNIDYFVDYCKRKNTVFQFTSCPMQNNWKEIPELIRFANNKDVRMMFHTVLYPHNFTLFGFNDNKLKLVNNYLVEASLKLPEETCTGKFNRQSMETLIYQISHFYNNNNIKKEWFAFEKGQKRFYKRKQLGNLEKQEQRKNIAIEKKKAELNFAGDKNYLIRYFRREVNRYCFKRYYYQPMRLFKLKKLINKKLDDFFIMYPEQDMAVDIVVTVFSHIPLNSIIQSLKNDNADKLFQGYLNIKKNEVADEK